MNRDYLTLTLLVGVAAASFLDILGDAGHGASRAHIVQEAVLLILALGLVAWIVQDLRMQRRQLRELQRDLDVGPTKSPDPEVVKARQGLRKAVNAQFESWGLSKSEREIGWLLLKGLSIREIAALRGTHEKTTRQQASSIYRKADLPGRHAFSAWFIEDLI